MSNKKCLVWILVFLMVLSFTGCSTSKMKESTGNAVRDDYLAKDEIVTKTEEPSTSLPENRKLIQTMNITAETEDLDELLVQIEKRIGEFEGYVENSYIQNGSAYSDKRFRNMSMTIRIPAESLDAFVSTVDEVSNVVSSRKTVDDVTLSYVATESRMKALQVEEARLLELLAKAETMSDLLTIEQRLTDVRAEIEQVTSALRLYDNQVDYATIHLSVEEVKEYTEVTEPETILQRIGSGFVKSLKGVGNFFVESFVFIIVASPYLILIGALVFVICYFYRKRRKNKKSRKQEEQKIEKKAEEEHL